MLTAPDQRKNKRKRNCGKGERGGSTGREPARVERRRKRIWTSRK